MRSFKMNITNFLLVFSIMSTAVSAQAPFITTWKTDNPGSSNSTSITIPTFGTGYNYDVDWNNDGVYDQFGITGDITHDYEVPGTYTIRLKGIFPRIYFNLSGDKEKILSIDQWGDIQWNSMENAFYGCNNLGYSAIDAPDLTLATSLNYMFAQCFIFNGNISNWNTATIANMGYMFNGCTAFNQNIGTWNTASVENMSGMFYGCSAFNQNISSWSTTSVTNMSGMFSFANAFNQNIGNWNTSSVNSMSGLFFGASNFNQNLGNWSLTEVTSLNNLLTNCGMDCDNYSSTLIGWSNNPNTPESKTLGAIGRQYGTNAISYRNNLITNKGWVISGDISSGTICGTPPLCTLLSSPLNGANAIIISTNIAWTSSPLATGYKLTIGTTSGGTQILNNADVGSVTSYDPMIDFPYNSTIYISITPYNSSGDAVGCVEETFTTESNFIPFITTWKTDNPGTSCTTCITLPTTGSGYNYDVDWNNDGVYDQFGITGDVTHDFGTAGTYTIRIKGSFPRIFFNNSGDKQKILSIDQWGDIVWSNMEWAFYECVNLGYTAIDAPDLSAVSSLEGMFLGCTLFNGDISNWNTSSITNMATMFSYASTFNQPIGGWNTSSLTDINFMFEGASSFNQPLGNWITTSITDMSGVFYDAIVYNQPLNQWITSDVLTMDAMFYGSITFNQPLNLWNTSNVNSMASMFSNASSFNQPLFSWNTANVNSMASMFSNATSFNQSLSSWNTSNSTSMEYMFEDASGFNQSLSDWNFHPDVVLSSMLEGSGMNCENYSLTLIGWSNNLLTPSGRSLGATGLQYGTNALSYRNNLITNKGWVISGDISSGTICGTPPVCTSLSSPLNGANGILISTNIAWTSSPIATGYKLTIGTTSGGTQILNNADVGNATIYDPMIDFPYNTTIYLRIIPYNANGDDVGCAEESFTTETELLPFITTWKTNNPGTSCASCITIPTTGAGYNYDVDWNNDGVYDQLGITGNVTHDFGTAGTYTIRIKGSFPRIFFNNSGDKQKFLSIDQWGDIVWASFAYAFWGCSNLGYSATDSPNLSNVTNMYFMFRDCSTFNGNIGNWNTAAVTNMSSLFAGASAFNQNIGNWNTASVTNMSFMFIETNAFNQTIGNWNTSAVTNMSNMFGNASAFNQNIGNWNTALVTDMSYMFAGALVFNQNIGNWNTASVTDMSFMFREAYAFNQNIGNWNTTSVNNMSSMFLIASSFNQNIGNWNTALVTNMYNIFNGASAFNQNIGNWTLHANVDLTQMLDNCGMSCENYDNTLIGWNNNPNTPNGRNLDAIGTSYWLSQSARNNLVNVKGWTINGDTYQSCNYGPPMCTSLSSPVNGATNVSVSTNLSWNAAPGATGYKLTIGTTSGGSDILNNADLGNVTTYDPTGDFPYNTIIHVKITPYNTNGDAVGCVEENFMTVMLLLPTCTSLTYPGNGATNVNVDVTFAWTTSDLAIGYLLFAGTTSGGTNLLDSFDVGNVTTFDPSGILPYNTTIFFKVVPYNAGGNATGCVETSFVTSLTGVAGFAYVANSVTDDVSVINTVSNAVVTTIGVGDFPYGACISPDGSKAFVTNTEGNSVTVINTLTHLVNSTIPLSANLPRVAAFSLDGSRAFVTTQTGTLFTIDALADTVISSIFLGYLPYSISVHPSGNRLYIGHTSDPIRVLNITNNTIEAVIPTNIENSHVVITPDGTKVFVGGQQNDSIKVISTINNQIIGSFSVGGLGLNGIVINKAGSKLYATKQYSNDVRVINTTTYSIENIIPLGVQPWGLSLNSDNTKLFVASPSNSVVKVISTSSNLVTNTIPVGSVPWCNSHPFVSGQPYIPSPSLLSLSPNKVKIKYHAPINASTATATNLKIWGDETGQRTGTYTTSLDTVIFTPATPFRSGELLHITSNGGLQYAGGPFTSPFSWVRQSKVSNPTALVFDTIGTGIILPSAAYGSNAGYQATMADVNRDGRQDLIYRYNIGSGASNILVYIRNANGSFAAPVTYTNTESYSTLIGTPDLNNDGYPDLVITHNVPARIQVMLNNGSGGFGAATLYVVNDYTSSANVYDLDRDGDLDIVAFSGNFDPDQNAINVLKNNGDGTFASATTLTTGVAYSGCVPADINNDGIFELLYTSDPYVTNNPVFRVYTNDGIANFTQYSSEPNPNIKSIRSAFDFDGNQSPDIITRNPNAEIHLANSGLSYTLNTPTVLDAQDSWMLAGDLDGDGDLDIMSTNRYNGSNWNTLPMKIYLNNGDGTFVTTTTSMVLPQISPIDLTDYDSDGDLDHIYLNRATGEIKVLLNNCSIVRTLTLENSPLSGTYKAAEMIDIQGNVSVSSSENVLLSAPLVKVSNQFNPGNLSNVTISPEGCATETPFVCGTSSVTFTYNGNMVTYGTVVSAGRCWLDRNLGATQVATSSTDSAAYGDLFQWGRGADGHQIRNPLSGTTPTLSSTDSPGHGSFITINSGNYDWRSPQNNNLWQGVTGVNNPCPSGFRLPTSSELITERMSWGSNNTVGAFTSPLKLTSTGFRWNNNSTIYSIGTDGFYLTSSLSGTVPIHLYFNTGGAGLDTDWRASGRSVRCIKDEVPITGTITTLNCAGATHNGTLTAGTSASGVNSVVPYTGGNGGTHNGQTVISVGVTGLTATLISETFANGAGSLTYTITGTPASAGTAFFALNIGGQSCTLTRTVNLPVGTIATLNCVGATNNGTLSVGTSASGVNSIVPYTGGNGGTHSGQAVTSTGVTGLIATLTEGLFAIGSESLTYTITGTPASSGTASFALSIGGQNCTLNRTVNLHVGTVSTLNCAGATNNGTLTVGTPTSGVSSIVPYTGGNGGTHSGQTVSSTGVTGLTATLSAGSFVNGLGSLTYTITGTPASSGTASFALSIGGQSCTLIRSVNLPVGIIATLNCAGATITGTLTSGVTVSGVSAAIPYTGGNGGPHSGQTVTSTGVIGLTAMLTAGSFASGSGSLTYTITGTPASAGTALFALNIGGQSCTLILNCAEVGNVHCNPSNPTAVVDVFNPTTGKIWMDRNLGANRSATSSTDAESYGSLFQWGRGADGHQCVNRYSGDGVTTSGTTTTLSSTNQPDHGNFILAPNDPDDWRSPQNGNLWQGVYGINNPCPGGYRLPTNAELELESTSWSSQNSEGAFASPLKLPLSGVRLSDGSVYNNGISGYYWSSTVLSFRSQYLFFNSDFTLMDAFNRVLGYAVRCIKDEVLPIGNIGSLDCGNTMITGTLISSIEANGVSLAVPYTNGNGGTYNGQSVTSTGVTGLTANLSAGSFVSGSSSLIYTVTGTPDNYGTASFALNIGGQACSLSMVVNAFGVFPEGTVHCNPGNPTAVVGVTNPLTGRTWMDRNLGAENVASSSNDAVSYGDLYQWGRRADGHQCRNSATTIILSSVDQPIHGDFILNGSNLFDWRSPQNTNLWQGIYGVNNPCPYGYRLPTDAELNAERLSWGNNNSAGALSSILKMPLAGYRNKSDGLLTSVGDFGTYWSSTINSTNSRGLFFDTNTAALFIDNRANGASVRCLIDAIVGSIGSLNCQNATIIIGTLISGVPAIDVSAEVPYTSGNGYSHSGQTVTSTGVTGLSATIAAGSFANGSGSLTYTITGIPTSAGAASFALNIGGQNCTLTVTVADLPYPSGTIHCNPSNPTAIVEVLNPLTGKTWMDRNLGANQVATSSTDTESYGDLYQWGRRADGHQCRTSPTTTILSSTDQPSHGHFIIISSGFEDWRSPQNTNLWHGVNGINNPCPAGFRVPTSSELDIERLSWSNNNAAGAFASPLKLPKAGYRNFNTGSFGGVGSVGGYWSSTVNSQYSHDLEFVNGSASNYSIPRAFGLSIRCTKDEIVPEASVGSLNCASTNITGILISGVAASGVSAVVPYTGGNGGFHTGQILTSTGVTGLTATLALGQIANGSGSLAYSITGTPASAGTALFALNIGGQACSLSVTIAPGSIGSINCAGATIIGTIISGVAASGVSRLVPYTGGNGGTHNGQMVTSTGVTGLTANLLSGLFVSGSGSLTYTITGTPASAGTALFALNIGGQSCSLSVTIAPGSIGSLNCASTNITGILISGLAASGASAAVTYTGGNGGAHSGQTVTSTGVIGLTATLTSGNFASGSGSLTYTITGTPSSTGTAAFALNIGGQSCMISVSVMSGSIESLICAGATISSTLISGVSASGVSASVPYTGGNGGNQSGQTVSSTGVTGLTAMLTAGSFASGSGSATYTITGTPLSAGTASFLLSIGGQSCSLSVSVAPGSIASLNCSGATIIGTLTSSFGASNVSATVPYTGGNGGSHSGQTVPSMGVYGLTAKLTALFFASGTGSLTYTITGTPTSAGTAVFGLNIGGQSCNLSLTVGSGAFTCGTSSVSFTYNGSPVTYGTIVSSGKCWLDRNLGASQVATSSTDVLAYGDLFQWGRGVDGHQIRSPMSGTITTLSSTDIPGNDKFIRINSGFNDWRSPQNNNLWQPLYGTTNPCPTGFRIPNTSEFNTERTSWSSNNSSGAFNSPLKLPLAGARRHDTGALLNVGSSGIYWSKNFNFGSSQAMFFTNSDANSFNYNRAYGFSVRCIKDENPNGSIGAIDCIGATISANAFSGLPANGITAIINYTLGDGGSYSGQSLTSLGVFGLIASLEPNSFSNGSGSLTYTISGTPSSAGIATFVIIIGGQTCSINVNVGTCGAPETFSYNGNLVTYGTVVSGGRCWLDRNLGASQVATSSMDALAYGDLFQWGRGADGHQRRNPLSGTTQTSSSADSPGHGNFITTTSGNYDWRSPQNENLWQGTNGINNPCPEGFRLPTTIEFEVEQLSWNSNNAIGAYASPLKLPVNGYREGTDGSVYYDNSIGLYWSSSVDGSYSRCLYFDSGYSYLDYFYRSNGLSVRCIKD